MSEQPLDRIDELLADRELWGLSEADQQELDRLLAEQTAPTGADLQSDWEHTAAATAATLGQLHSDSPPAELLQKLERDAVTWWVDQHDVGLGQLEHVLEPPAPVTPIGRLAPPPGVDQRPAPSILGWAVAAAAMIVATVLWATRDVTPTATALFTQIASNADVRAEWAPVKDQVQGEVVWNSELQAGVMKLSGVPINDPTQSQYQLWIIDGDRKNSAPVDGGIFDVDAASGAVYVKIDAKIPVGKVAAFAITKEVPGGVVVSNQEHVVTQAVP